MTRRDSTGPLDVAVLATGSYACGKANRTLAALALLASASAWAGCSSASPVAAGDQNATAGAACKVFFVKDESRYRSTICPTHPENSIPSIAS